MNAKLKSSFEIVLDHMNADNPVNLAILCNELGVKLSHVILDDQISGEIELLRDGGFSININRNHHPNRQRFTIAHELGHFIHHRSLIGDGVNDNKMYRSINVGKFFNHKITLSNEREANIFAATLLMPKKAIYKLHREKITASEMAAYFKVSNNAILYRLQGLGIPSK